MDKSKVSLAAFIPARGGSKSIPLKNIMILGGKPLIYYVVKAASLSKSVDMVFVSTDSSVIKKCVEAFCLPKVVVIDRSPVTATDEASTESAMIEFAKNFKFEDIILLQATSPLVTSSDIDKCYLKYRNNDYDSMISLVKSKKFSWICKKNYVYPQNYTPNKRPLRQQWDGDLIENGNIYLTSKKQLLESNCRVSGKIGSYIMEEVTSYEIDEPDDINIVENLLVRQNTKRKFKLNKIKAVISDVDGVLTNGRMIYTNDGNEGKTFNTRDGMAFELFRKKGIKTGICTSENTKIVENRAHKVKCDYLYQGCNDKLKTIKNICQNNNFGLDNILFVGDDINDLELCGKVGFFGCPSDAVRQIKQSADYITTARGGEGVLREIYDSFFGP